MTFEHWLSLKQALPKAPDIATTKGLRARAFMAVLFAGALRRSGVAARSPMGARPSRCGSMCATVEERSARGQRKLDAVVIRARRGASEESAFESARRYCRALCAKPRLAAQPSYGSNNWYYAYGQNCSAEDVLRDSSLTADLAPAGQNRPFVVIDDGWQITNTAGPWERGNSRFPDMARLAAEMKQRGVRPGIWIRPLYTTAAIPPAARLDRIYRV